MGIESMGIRHRFQGDDMRKHEKFVVHSGYVNEKRMSAEKVAEHFGLKKSEWRPFREGVKYPKDAIHLHPPRKSGE